MLTQNRKDSKITKLECKCSTNDRSYRTRAYSKITKLECK